MYLAVFNYTIVDWIIWLKFKEFQILHSLRLDIK